MIYLFIVATSLLLVSLGLYFLSHYQRQKSGLPLGKIIYTDAGDWKRNERPLYSSRFHLTGKPDYLVQHGKEVIPVEVKSTRLQGRPPYESHQMQLAAYCLLVEEVMGVRPNYGILKYADTTIRIDYTKNVRRKLLETLDEMQHSFRRKTISRSHEDAIRCRYCGFRHKCDQKLI